MTAALELQQVCCVRGGRPVFGPVSATIPAGTVLRVEGPNGAGKTSLLRLVCGLAVPAAGDVVWRGRPVWPSSDAFNADLVYLGHAPALKGELSAAENLRAGCALVGVPCGMGDATAALAGAGLREHARVPTRTLSQGQRRRAVLARLALSARAGLWVLDEPFDALDDGARGWLRGHIAAQVGRGGVVVLTSHDPVVFQPPLPQVKIALAPIDSELAA